MALPTWEARMVQMPTATIVTVAPFVLLVVQTAVVWLAKVTGLPDAPPVAETVKAVSLKVLPASAPKVIVCAP